MPRFFSFILLLLNLNLSTPVLAADQVSLSGSLQALACPQVCGSCCGTHSITDTTGNIKLEVGNAFVDLGKLADDGKIHRFSGYFYNTTGQCGLNTCSLFAVESIDIKLTPAAVYESAKRKLSIQAVVIDGDKDSSYSVILDAPFNVVSAADAADSQAIAQGRDCSASQSACAGGTQCVAYFGIAGSSGPEFKTCEIPCSHPGARCPLGQSCVTIADGPGQVCSVD